MTSLARELPRQTLLPAPEKMKVPSFIFIFCYKTYKNSIILMHTLMHTQIKNMSFIYAKQSVSYI